LVDFFSSIIIIDIDRREEKPGNVKTWT